MHIIECKDGNYYTVTNDLEKRLWQHNTGYIKTSYTYETRPDELKYFETFSDINQAIAREKQLKGWSRKNKQALMTGSFETLKEFSKSKKNRQ